MQELLARDGPFRQLVRDFGSAETDVQTSVNVATPDEPAKEHEKQEGKAFIEEEERETGSISLSTWTFWLRGMGSPVLVIAAFLGYIIAQGSQIVHAFFLAQWQSNAYPQLSQGAYQGIYAGIGVLCALLSFASTALFIVLVIKGSVWACITALHRIMGSPMSFLNRTPVRPAFGAYADQSDGSDCQSTDKRCAASLSSTLIIVISGYQLTSRCRDHRPLFRAYNAHGSRVGPSCRPD
jgi:hypothetical protein